MSNDDYKKLFINDGDELPLVFKYHLQGKSADKHLADLHEISISLDGLERLIYISERLLTQHLPTKRIVPNRSRIRIAISPPKKGSWESDVIAVIGIFGSMYAPELREGNDKAGKWLWSKMNSLFNLLINSIDDARDTHMLAEIILTETIREAKHKINEVDLAKTIRLLVQALIDFSEPLEKSAETMYLSHSGQMFSMDQENRKSIIQPLPDAEDIPIGEPYWVPVKFVRLNIKTGRGLINFVNSPESQRHCIINDNIFEESEDHYTAAFTRRGWLYVELIKIAPSESGRQNYFRILNTDGEFHKPPTLLDG